MALSFLVCTAPDSHVEFLAENPSLVHFYLDGDRPPAEKTKVALPFWWPSSPPQRLESWNINHRNTELYHWILNGSSDFQSGAGSIFQAWHNPTFEASFLKLDPHNERFAFYSDQLPELRRLVQAVDLQRVMTAFRDWLLSQGDTWGAENVPDKFACEPFVEEFDRFDALLGDAISHRLGIIW